MELVVTYTYVEVKIPRFIVAEFSARDEMTVGKKKNIPKHRVVLSVGLVFGSKYVR